MPRPNRGLGLEESPWGHKKETQDMEKSLGLEKEILSLHKNPWVETKSPGSEKEDPGSLDPQG